MSRLSWRRRFAVAGLAFLAFAVYRVFGVYTVRTGRCNPDAIPLPSTQEMVRLPSGATTTAPRRPADTSANPPLRLMTYNIEGHAALIRPDHIAEVARAIREQHPDVVGLQEVHRNTWQSRFSDQAAELARLTGMRVAYGRSFSTMGGEYGNAVLTRGRIIDQAVYELPSVGEPRSALRCQIDLDGRRVNVFVTHLATWGFVRRSSRREQINCVVALAKASAIPFVVVGDFNAEPDAPEVRELRDSPQIQMLLTGDEGTHRITHQVVDYIITDYGWEPVGRRVVRRGPSDHWPVVAEIRWNRSEREGAR